MKILPRIDTYETYDIQCAAVLLCCNFELLSLDKTQPKKVKFIFKRKEKLDELINKFWSDQLKVKARSLLENLKILKNRIYSD